jgi:hypothetical protein
MEEIVIKQIKVYQDRFALDAGGQCSQFSAIFLKTNIKINFSNYNSSVLSRSIHFCENITKTQNDLPTAFQS